MGFDNRLIIECFGNVVNILIWLFSTNDQFRSEKYESNYLGNPFPEMKGVNLLLKTDHNDKSQESGVQEILMKDKAFFLQLQLKTCSACALVAGTQRFFLLNVAKSKGKIL